ncbi:hypothetical protein BT96DRAFT_1007551 [Gymnopus androsaceus JB14]|uniref:Uncharacterized protein n=1 Tax=Gymnopus androsaceus JB14 TaxID=1447944 RepID=A0A6A4GHE8_9AGAR|nr:hypothetical protein BT96DRAFT_1007551 [Gymnopus androsaceus JB14]
MPPGKKQKLVCNDPYCRFPMDGSDEKAHTKMYHLQSHTVTFNGREVVLNRRDDGKIPCACFLESHARYNYQKIYSMIRRKTHPPPGDSNADIAFQISAPPRPPSDPVDATNPAFISTEAASKQPSILVPPGSISEPSASLAMTPSPQEPISESPASSSAFTAVLNENSVPQLNTGGQPSTVDGTIMSQHDQSTPEPLPSPTGVISHQGSSHHSDLGINNVRGAMDVDEDNVEGDKENESISEDDSDSGGESEDDMDVDLPDLPSDNRPSHDVHAFLLLYGIQVEPIYRFVVCIEPECQQIISPANIHSHKLQYHYKNTRILPSETRLPPANEILSAIRTVGGFDPVELDPAAGPIQPITGVKIMNGKKCTTGDCTGHVYGSNNPLVTHQSSVHSNVQYQKRSFEAVKCQPLNALKSRRNSGGL